MPATLSIITCTRNPRADLLDRVMASVAALRVPAGESIEYLLIDSMSSPPLAGRPEVAAFTRAHAWARLLRCDEVGVAAARRMGVRESQGDLIAWIDDDNVPAPDYLERAVETSRAHPQVTVWGAGRIRVEFIDPVPAWADPWLRSTFQEREHPHDEFGRATTWAAFFPVGSGMVARRAALSRWERAGREGRLTLTGRAGSALTSGEDAEMIFGAVAAGEEVGVCARQSLTHLIPASRCTMRYLRRLERALASSVRVARAECFPGDPAPASLDGLGPWPAARAVFSRWRRVGWRDAVLEWSRRAGAREGARLAARHAAGLSRR